MLTRRLALRRETLTALSGDDLNAVGGGAAASGPTCYTCLDCVEVSQSYIIVTECCSGIPTFHRGC